MSPLRSQKVLVTGATGFVAAWAVRHLLDAGYLVRGTVRSIEKGERLQEIFGDAFEYVVVKDVSEEGAFDEAVRGVDFVEHVASPYTMNSDKPEELIIPAVRGTVGILKSTLKYGSSVRRVVVTSSTIAVATVSSTPRTFTEASWNDYSVKQVEKLGRDAIGYDKYATSKVLAERSVWSFIQEHEHEMDWDVVVLNPPYVFGPTLTPADGLSALNASVQAWFSAVFNDPPAPAGMLDDSNCWVDVRDLADAHVNALHSPGASNQRIVVSAGTFSWRDFVEIVNGTTRTKKKYMVFYDTDKAAKLLGVRCRSKEAVAQDMAEEYHAKWA